MAVTRTEIETQVLAALAFASEQEVSAVDLGADFDSLGLDSVGRVELLARVEDSFETHVPPDDAIHLGCGQDVVRYLARRLA
ncbi:MAG: acyl carrier protein [Planctomycetes bacterium]|nr:acyl carrier protein [Planctomycetota bacterium]